MSELTRKMLDDFCAAVAKRGSEPRHDCSFDGHVLQFNPHGFHFCVYCGASEAELERPAKEAQA